MATKAEVLNYPMVGGKKGAEHEAHLQSRIDSYASHFEAGEHTGESGFECDDHQ